MLAGIRAAQNTLGSSHDVWAVNVESEYLEEVEADKVEEGCFDCLMQTVTAS